MMRRLGLVWVWIIYGFLYLPIVIVVIYSFNNAKYSTQWKGFTLQWYQKLMDNTPLIDAALNSLSIACLSATLATILGVFTALCIKRYLFPFSKFLHAVIYILTVSPDMVMGISLLVFFIALNIKLGFLSLFIAHTTLSLPFVTLTVLDRLKRFNEDLVDAARDLGASELQAFFYVIVPLIMPGIIAGWLLAFTLSIDDVLVSFFVAGPTFEVLPLKIYSMVRLGVKPDINALSAIMFCVTVAFVAVAWTFLRPKARRV